MSKIVCGVDDCSHNKAGECYAKLVSINGGKAVKSQDTCCSSFMNQTVYSELTNSNTTKEICSCLDCNVESCKHNDNCVCLLDYIKVNGDNVNYYTETCCLSFAEK